MTVFAWFGVILDLTLTIFWKRYDNFKISKSFIYAQYITYFIILGILVVLTIILVSCGNIDYASGIYLPSVLDGVNEPQKACPRLDWILIYTPLIIIDVFGSIVIGIIIYRIASHFGLQGFKSFFRLFLFLFSSLIQVSYVLMYRVYLQVINDSIEAAFVEWVACINSGGGTSCKLRHLMNYDSWVTTQLVTGLIGLWYAITFGCTKETYEFWKYIILHKKIPSLNVSISTTSTGSNIPVSNTLFKVNSTQSNIEMPTLCEEEIFQDEIVINDNDSIFEDASAKQNS